MPAPGRQLPSSPAGAPKVAAAVALPSTELPHLDEPAERPRIAFAASASLLLHVLLLLVAMLAAWYAPPVGYATKLGHGETAVDLGPASSLEGMNEPPPGDSPSLNTPADLTAAAAMAPADSLSAQLDPLATSSIDNVSGGAGDSGTFGAPGADGSGTGGGGGDGLGGAGGGAKFFGIEARGSRFMYICDVSGSMSEERRISALRTALIESITALSSSSQFSIVIFETEATQLTGPNWVTANPAGKAEARLLINSISPHGGTQPVPGFIKAFAMRPRPDAAYFMTDGQFGEGKEDATIAQIVAIASDQAKKCPIHCITLVETSGEKMMKEIARRSGGKYRHEPGPPATPFIQKP